MFGWLRVCLCGCVCVFVRWFGCWCCAGDVLVSFCCLLGWLVGVSVCRICLSVCLSFICLVGWLVVCLFGCVVVCLFVRWFACWFVLLAVFVWVFVCLFFRLFVLLVRLTYIRGRFGIDYICLMMRA